jgi:hypothetical protein
MKKSFIIGLLGVVGCATASFGQGVISLDNYTTSGPIVTYGTGDIPANGANGSQGVVGTGLQSGWTLGFFYVIGNVTVGSDPSGGNFGDPSTYAAGFILATGPGSTAEFGASSFNTPGEAFAPVAFSVPGTATGGGDAVTVIAVAYAGSSYFQAPLRGHSAAFTMTTSANISVIPNRIGSSMPAFSIFVIPEPSIAVLSALGGLALVGYRRRG